MLLGNLHLFQTSTLLALTLLLGLDSSVFGIDNDLNRGAINHHYNPPEKNVRSPRYIYDPCNDDTDVFELTDQANEQIVEFLYEIETVNIVPVVLERTVLKRLERTIIEELLKTSIFDDLCERRLLSASVRRRLPVVGITTAPEDEIIGLDCQQTTNVTNDCFVIDGEFRIRSDAEQPIETAVVVDQIRILMNEDEAFEEFIEEEDRVVGVRFREQTVYQLTEPQEPLIPNGVARAPMGLRSSAYAIIAVAAVLVLGGGVVYRRRRNAGSDSDTGSQPTDLSAPQEDESHLPE